MEYPNETRNNPHMEDREGIRQLLTTYCMCLDHYDMAALAETFTVDAIMDQGPGRGGQIKGRSSIVAGVKQRQSLFKRTCHQLGQSAISIANGLGHGITYVTATHQDWEGRVATAYLRYQDVYKKVEGQWKIAERSSHVMLVQGFDEAQWNWVTRIKPDNM